MNLPDELIKHVASYLTLEDKINLLVTQQNFKNLVYTDASRSITLYRSVAQAPNMTRSQALSIINNRNYNEILPTLPQNSLKRILKALHYTDLVDSQLEFISQEEIFNRLMEIRNKEKERKFSINLMKGMISLTFILSMSGGVLCSRSTDANDLYLGIVLIILGQCSLIGAVVTTRRSCKLDDDVARAGIQPANEDVFLTM